MTNGGMGAAVVLCAGILSALPSFAPPAQATVTTLTCTQPTAGTVNCELPDVEGTIYVELQEVLAAAQSLDASITATTPMIITAWGGQGGHGWDQSSLVHYGSGGDGGFAQTQTTLTDYELTYGTPVLFYFLGLPGTDAIPTDTVYGGLGATSTLAGPGNLYSDAACIAGYGTCSTPNVLLVAGGGGGGGQAGDSDSGGNGGSGATAIGSLTSATSGRGSSGNDGNGSGGHGGAPGDAGSHGSGGDGGIGIDAHAGGDGTDGIGGVGGPVHDVQGATPTEEWSNAGLLTPIGTDGAGGEGQYRGTPPDVGSGGGGGGGFGGGGGGGGGGNTESGGGGGGGGSYAAAATAQAAAPTLTQDGSNGEVMVSFVVQQQKLVFMQQPSSIVAGETTSATTVQLEDQAGNAVAQAGVLVTLSLAKGTTISLQQATTDSSGLATFAGVTLTTVGGYHLSASAANVDPGVSSVFVVSPTTGWSLAFVQQPSDVTAAQTMTPAVTVQLEDSDGTAIAASQVPIELLLDPSATLSNNIEETDSSGLATFSELATSTAGTYTLKALADAATPEVSDSFTVAAESADTLAFIQPPTDVIVGGPITPAIAVQIEDAYGNATGGSGIEICLRIDPGATITDNCTYTNGSGFVSYDSFTIQPIGTYTLTAHGTGQFGSDLQEVTSAPFGVTAGTASGLAWAVMSGEVTAGHRFSPTVQVVNQYGVAFPQGNVTVELHLGSASGRVLRTALTDASGSATFAEVVLFKSGTSDLVATAPGLGHATFEIIVLAGAVPIRLAFVQQPTDVTVGEVVSPPVTVQLKALFDNDTPGDCDSCQPVVVQLLLDGTEVGRADAGIFGLATFDDLTFSIPGTYQLTAKRLLTDEADFPLIPALSQPFTVNVAPGSPSPTPTVTPTASPTSASTAIPPCPGDCDGNGEVTINELVLMVNISLGNLPVSACEAGDLNGSGEITIDELIRSVNAALVGC